MTEQENQTPQGNGSSKRNLINLPDLPMTTETANLREGPDFNHELLALLPLVGVWRGSGQGVKPETEEKEFNFGQQIIISHDGGSYLIWDSIQWTLSDDETKNPEIFAREKGFLTIKEKDNLEFVVTHSSGFVEVYYGKPLTQTSWELATDIVMRTQSAENIGGAKRLYGLVNGDLAYVEERLINDELKPTYSAQLSRWAG